MIARAFNISGESATVYYLDADQVADYAKPYLAEMSALGYITDSSDGYFRPTDAITRAEIVTILDNMIEVLIQTSTTYTQDVEGTVMVNAAEGACLQDMTITGDLILAPGVTGTVTLENVTIQGAVRNFGSAWSRTSPSGRRSRSSRRPSSPATCTRPRRPQGSI